MPSEEDYTVTSTVIEGIPVKCTTYRVGQTYHCVIANESPGANVARGSGPTREAAVFEAAEKARRRFTKRGG